MASTKHEIKPDSWSDGGEAPFEGPGFGSVVDGNVAYFLSGDNQVYSFDSSTKIWNLLLPPSPISKSSLTMVNGLLTVVGGWPPFDSKATKMLYSLKKGKEANEWVETFPPMSTARHSAMTITWGNHHDEQIYLIVVGGMETLELSSAVDAVEILNIAKQAWSKAASLPLPLSSLSSTICGKLLYISGGKNKDGLHRSVYSCDLEALIESRKRKFLGKRKNVWEKSDFDTPMYESTCATVEGQLVAIGGFDNPEQKKETKKIYKFNPSASVESRAWREITQMKAARSSCNVAMINNELLVVFGGIKNDTVDIAQI